MYYPDLFSIWSSIQTITVNVFYYHCTQLILILVITSLYGVVLISAISSYCSYRRTGCARCRIHAFM